MHRYQPPRLFVALMLAYLFASLGHFAHNAEFICSYPNLPSWLTTSTVYASWIAITSVGVLGVALLHLGRVTLGLLVVGVYASLGFDGLGHYALAPMAFHPLAANITILTEVAAGAVLLLATGWLLARYLSRQVKDSLRIWQV